MSREAHDHEAAEVVLSIVAELAGELRGGRAPRVGLDVSLERDLGLGSLERMELARRLERRFDIALSEAVVARAETPRELMAALRAGVARPEVPSPAPLEPGARAGAPERAATLIDVLEWHAATHGERVHLRVLADDATHEDVSYASLLARSRALAAALAARGARPAETIGLMLPTSRAYFEAFCAVLLAGAIPVPLYPPGRPTQAAEHLRRQARILANADARMLIAAPEVVRAAQVSGGSAPRLRAIVTTDELSRGDDGHAPARAAPDDVALVQYTSGSTGEPKGVVLTHANLLANVRAMGESTGASPDDVFVSWLPLYHDMGLIGAWMGSLIYGFPLVVMSPLAFLSRPVRWLRAIHDHRGTISAAPNFAYELCITKVDDRELAGIDLGSWRLAFNGAEPVSSRTLQRFAGRFAPHGLRPSAIAPVYGLAECCVGLAFPPVGRAPLLDRVRREVLAREGRAVAADPGDPDALEIVACGRALPRHSIRVVDDDGREVPARVVGRIEFQGPSATRGYLRNPGATRALFDGEWLDTGDLGYLADGELFVTGRVKDLVIRAGRNLHPHEIEEAAGLVPGVRRGCVAAFASRDPHETGERLVVVAETRLRDEDERRRLREQIVAAVVDRVGVPPDEVVLAPPHAVRKTSSGKIRRAATREAWERRVLVGEERPLVARVRLMRLAVHGARAALVRHARRAGAALFAAWAWSALAAIVVLGGLPAILLPGVDRRRRLAHSAARVLCRIVGIRIEREGLDRLPRDRACVLVSNHASYLDSIVLLAALPHDLDYAFVAKAELGAHAALRVPLARLGIEQVRRSDVTSSIEDAQHLVERARGGRSLLVYPEATTEPAAGILPFRLGAFVAAAETGAPVVPIALRGTRAILPPGRWSLTRGIAHLVVGTPIGPRDASFESAVTLRDLARAWILRHTGEPDLAEAWEPAREAAAHAAARHGRPASGRA